MLKVYIFMLSDLSQKIESKVLLVLIQYTETTTIFIFENTGTFLCAVIIQF